MADVTGHRDRSGGDRAQLLLVGAVTLAAALVAVALIINTAIYTENLATRTQGNTAQDAIEFQQTTRSGVSGAIQRVNYHNNTTTGDYDPLTDALDVMVADWSAASTYHGAMRARSVDATVDGTTDGTRVVQPAERNFTDLSGTGEDWDVTPANAAVRSFRLSLNRSNLTTNKPTDADRTFHVQFEDEDTGDIYELYVHRTNTTDDAATVITYQEPAAIGGGEYKCPEYPQGDWTTIDVMAAEVDGQHCNAIERMLGDLSADYQIGLDDTYLTTGNTDPTATGTYEFVVNKSYSAVDDGELATTPGTDPYVTTAVYSVDASITYRTQAMNTTDDVTVTPESRLYDIAGRDGGGAGDGGGGGGGSGGAPSVSITSYSMTDGGCNGCNNNNAKENKDNADTVEVTWDASDGDSDIVEVTVRVYDMNAGPTILDPSPTTHTYTDVGSASETDTFSVDGQGITGYAEPEEYRIIVTVEDGDGTTDDAVRQDSPS